MAQKTTGFVHGAEDAVCPVEDAREMVANMEASGMDIEAIWVTKEMLDGETFHSTGHPMGDRTRGIVKVKVAMLNPDERLFPELSATVHFLPDQKDGEANLSERKAVFAPVEEGQIGGV